MKDTLEEAISHEKKLKESERLLRDRFGQLEQRLKQATVGINVYVISNTIILEDYGPDDCLYGHLSFNGFKLSVKHRTREDDYDYLSQYDWNEPWDPSYKDLPISLCSMVWLRKLAEAEVLKSLSLNLSNVIEAQAMETMEGVRSIEAALNYPALQLNSDLEKVAKKLGYEKTLEYWKKAQLAVEIEPKDAVTQAYSLIETVCKHILEQKKVSLSSDMSLRSLLNETIKALKICPEEKLLSEDIKKMSSGVISIAQGVGNLRSHFGSAHGRGAKHVELDPSKARLVVNSSGVITTFLMETMLSDEKTNQAN